jgi:hypothetical protein
MFFLQSSQLTIQLLLQNTWRLHGGYYLDRKVSTIQMTQLVLFTMRNTRFPGFETQY